MSQLTVTLPEQLLKKLETLAQAQSLTLDEIVLEALEEYTDEEEASKEDILLAMKENFRAALAEEGQDAFEALAELRQELLDDAD